MAVCEIWDVKGRLDHPIDYAKNPEKTVNPKYTEADLQALGDVMKYATNGEKTEKQFFVTGVNCDPATARDVSRPRQHRHLKRKNSILFLVFLDFPHFFIHSGWQDTLF